MQKAEVKGKSPATVRGLAREAGGKKIAAASAGCAATNDSSLAGAGQQNSGSNAMASEHKLLTDLYAAFNARDIDRCLAGMQPDVTWANGMDGGYVHGHEGVRDYWTR